MEVVNNEQNTLRDEFCPNKPFEKESKSDEDLIEKILITADCQADWNDKVVTKLITEKLHSIGMMMMSI